MVALGFAGSDQLLWQTFQWVSLVFGGLLGVFLLGVDDPRPEDATALTSWLCWWPAVGLVVLKLVQDHRETVYIAWPWWIAIGTGLTFLIGSLSPHRFVRSQR